MLCRGPDYVHAIQAPKVGVACLKIFDHIHDYGFNKKQVNLRATGLSCLGLGQNKYRGYSKKNRVLKKRGTQIKYRVLKTNIVLLKTNIGVLKTNRAYICFEYPNPTVVLTKNIALYCV